MSSFTEGGPLANYNSLVDRNLSGYFANTRMRKHLVKSGLITRNGEITSENSYRLRNAKKEHKEHVRELLASAIVEKALDLERMRQHEIRKKLDELYKIELVSKVRSDKSGKDREELHALLSLRSSGNKKRASHRNVKSAAVMSSERGMTRLPDIHYDDRPKKLYETSSIDSQSTSRYSNPRPPGRSISAHVYGKTSHNKTPHPPPPKSKKKKKRKVHRGLMLARSEQLVAHRVQVQSMAEVTMKFLGSSLHLTNDMFPANKLTEIQVIQQHCGASTVCLFREMLPPKTVFTFVSRRHRGSPFGLTINIDGIKNIRISSCCEYKHKPGFRLGGKNSQFGLISVQGAAPCYRCQVRLNLLEQNKKDGDVEREASSDDEEAATRSFDIIVSRGGKRQEAVKDRPISANVTTQTEAAFKEFDVEEGGASALEANSKDDGGEEYQDDFFEDEEDDDEDSGNKINEGDMSSSDSDSKSSDSESDGDGSESDSDTRDKDDKNVVKKRLSAADEKEETESHTETETETDAKKESTTDDVISDNEEKLTTGDSDNSNEAVKPTSSDDDDDESTLSERHVSKNSDGGEPSRADDTESHVYLQEEVGGSSKAEDDSDNESVKSKDSDKEKGSSSDDSDAENDKAEKEGSSSSASSSEDEKDNNDKAGRKADSDHDDEADGDENDLENNDGGSVPSVVSRESSMLTGNEDGRCESVNKTIQFNEEVDVVHYEKADVDSTAENTPRSDDDSYDEDDYNDEDFDTIKSGGERVILADFGDDIDDDEDAEEEGDNVDVKKNVEESEEHVEDGDNVLDAMEGEEEEATIIESEGSEDTDHRIFDKGSDPEPSTDLNNNNNSFPREPPTEPIKTLIGDEFDHVDLVNLELSAEQSGELVTVLAEHKHEIESLSLRNIRLHGGLELIKEVVMEMKNLKVLNLNDNELTEDDTYHLAEILSKCGQSITNIVLNGNPIYDDGLWTLLRAVKNLSSLTSLDVGHCEITDDGTEAILDYLTENTSLVELTLSRNNFTAEGWLNIASALKSNKTLKTLSIDSSGIGDEELKVICQGIEENKSLECVDIENNKISDAGGECLFNAIQKCETILDVTLQPCSSVSSAVEEKIRDLINERVAKLTP